MALQKEITANNGVVTGYHKISNLHLDTPDDGDTNRLSVMVDSYLNEEYRAKGASINSKNYTFRISKDEDATVGIRVLAYNKLKELDEWADAVDC